MKTIRLLAALLLLCLTAFGESRPGPLFEDIRKNDLAFLTDQLSKGADGNSRDDRGGTLLMHAAAFGSLEAVHLCWTRAPTSTCRTPSALPRSYGAPPISARRNCSSRRPRT